MICDAVTKGIGRDIAERAVRQLFLGGSTLLADTEQMPAEIVQTFLDYAGTTAAGLEAMAAADIRTSIARGLTAAAARAAGGTRGR
ncbi:pyrroline-5-carboxylate reductase [compost metagenome]